MGVRAVLAGYYCYSVLFAIYDLTSMSEASYASQEKISEMTALPLDTVEPIVKTSFL